MKTGDQYRTSIVDGRDVYFEGEAIKDLNEHKVMGMAADGVAAAYDRFYDPAPGVQNPLLGAPRGVEALRDRVVKLAESGDVLTSTTYQSLATLTSAAPKVGETRPEYVERMYAFQDFVLKEDMRITQCITDAKGNRSSSPGKQDDKDSYVHVVDRSPDGVVIRGAKLHITGASFGHELMTIPTKAMKAGEEDYAIACVVPVNAPGVKIIDTTPAPPGDEIRRLPGVRQARDARGVRDLRRRVRPERARLPGRRGRLRGDVRALARAVGAARWHRVHGRRRDVLVGLAQLIAEANGDGGDRGTSRRRSPR